MINNDRIVPVQKIDLLSLYGTIYNLLDESGITPLVSTDVLGDFIVEENGTYLANQPVKTCDFADSVTSAVVYFIPDFAFVGFSINGTAAEVEAEIQPDGVSLYKAVLADSAVTVSAVTPSLS